MLIYKIILQDHKNQLKKIIEDIRYRLVSPAGPEQLLLHLRNCENLDIVNYQTERLQNIAEVAVGRLRRHKTTSHKGCYYLLL